MKFKRNLIIFGAGSLLAHVAIAAFLLLTIQQTKVIEVSPQGTHPVLQVSMLSQSSTEQQDDSRADKLISKQDSGTLKKKISPVLNLSSSREIPPQTVGPLPTIDTDVEINEPTKLATEIVQEAPLSATQEKANSKKLTATDVSTISNKNTLIHEKLSALITINKQYPRFAVRRGWEGTVKLGLRVEADGKLTRLRILKTSGYRILDEAALTMLSSASNLNGVERWLDGHYFDTTLPVEYRLTGG